MNVIEIQDVDYQIGHAKILSGINLSLPEGKVLGLFGHNGAGKTTCMKLILGLSSPNKGRVEVLGASPKSIEIRRQRGYLPENIAFYPQLTGKETLAYFARLRGAAPQQVDRLLEQVGLAHAAKQKIKTYSRGMRQRLGLAQALLGEPRLLLLDEPTLGLDPVATRGLYQLIEHLRQQGTSVVLCSHALAGIEGYLDNVAILNEGRLLASGSLRELAATAELPVYICIRGLNDAEQKSIDWQKMGYQTDLIDPQTIEIRIDNQHKMAFMRSQLTAINADDIEVRQPSLEDLYCYFTVKPNQHNEKEC